MDTIIVRCISVKVKGYEPFQEEFDSICEAKCRIMEAIEDLAYQISNNEGVEPDESGVCQSAMVGVQMFMVDLDSIDYEVSYDNYVVARFEYRHY